MSHQLNGVSLNAFAFALTVSQTFLSPGSPPSSILSISSRVEPLSPYKPLQRHTRSSSPSTSHQDGRGARGYSPGKCKSLTLTSVYWRLTLGLMGPVASVTSVKILGSGLVLDASPAAEFKLPWPQIGAGAAAAGVVPSSTGWLGPGLG